MRVGRAMLLSVMLSALAVGETIRVGAAISLKDALATIATKYEAAAGEKLEFTFGASGQVLQQIKSGAAVDVFVSAADKQVDDLVAAGLADAASRRVVAGNTLVLIVPADAATPPTSLKALASADVKKVAIGEPKTVPAGQYATQALSAAGVIDALAGRLVYGTNVRQVLTYVEGGEVSAGLVYGTDARESGAKVRVTATVDATTHEPIVYPAVIVKATAKPDAARKFLDYLAGDDAQAVLADKGFVRADAVAKK